jgi:oxygen-independent coproporphyrinogen-3 oxidase
MPICGYEDINEEQRRLELISLGMRSKLGLHIEEIRKGGISLDALESLQSLGFLTLKDDLVVPTIKGFLVADHIPIYLSC